MRIGVARIEISPWEGIDLSGFIAREGPCTGTHDPLYATALVAEEGDRRVALISCDLIGLGAATVRRVRRAAEQATGIPADAQMYACTHTHAGPETGTLTTLGNVDPEYMCRLERQLVDVLSAANARLQPARLGWARESCPDAAHNRVLASVGQDDRQIDADVIVARCESLDGQPLAAIVHYTCHPTAAGSPNTLASADWCGVTRAYLEDAKTGPVVIVNGAGGDINPRMGMRGFDAVRQTGRSVGEVARGLWARTQLADDEGVDFRCADVPLAMLPLAGTEEIVRLLQRWREVACTNEPGSMVYRAEAICSRDYAQRLIRLHWGSEAVPAYAGETQAIRIGPLAVVSLPGEFFSAYGRQIKASSPAPATMIAGWTNDNLGYFPTAELFPLGGYEADTAFRYYGFPAPWAPEAGAAVTYKAIDLVQPLFG